MLLRIVIELLLVYLGLSVGYLFVLAIAGRFWYRNPWTSPGTGESGNLGGEGMATFRSIAILVPAYKEDSIILSTAEHLLLQEYPAARFDIHILADSLKKETIATLRTLPIHVWPFSFQKSMKSRSLNAFFLSCKTPYDLVLICDADNMLGSGFLQKVNRAFDRGALAVQGKRVAKNIDTPFAMLDACSEAINNHIFRQGASALGLSASLIGSGMVFEFNTLKEIIPSIEAVGEDKILQLKIVEKGIKIEYLEDALIFDEKIDSPKAFQQQRRRWVYSQYVNLKEFFLPGMAHLFKGNVHYFNLAVGNNLVMPRSFLMAVLPVVGIGTFFLDPVLGWWTMGIWLVYLATLLIALPPGFFRKELGMALLHLPKAVWMMLMTLPNMRSANKGFIHTVHSKTTISNNLYNP